MKKIFLSFVLLASLMLGLVSAQTLTYARSRLPVSMDSADAPDGNSLTVTYQIVENLVQYELGSTELKPGLATDWSANDDSTVWTFNLREGVMFHDGTPFNADAVKFNLDRWNDPSHPNHYADSGKTYTPWSWVFGGPVGEGILAEVEVVDEYTVRLHMTGSTGLVPSMVAASYFGLDSPSAVQAAGADYGTPGVGAVGTGAFMFSEWIEGERVVLDANPDYWGGTPGVERLVFRGIEDPTACLAELQAGAVDIAVDLNPDDLSVVEGDSSLTRVPGPSLNIGYLAMHQANEPLNDIRVRMAIAHAIDWDELVLAFYGELGLRATEHIPPAFAWARAGVPAYEYNVEEAQRLLAEAGYPDGFDTELWYMPVSRPYFPAPEPIATAMASFLADIGINAELKTEDWGVYLSNYDTGKYPMYMLGWSPDYGDPDNYLYTFFGPAAAASYGWDSPEAITVLDKARELTGLEARGALYNALNTIVYNSIPSIPVAHNSVLYAASNSVENWIPNPLGASSDQLYLLTKSE